jgi:protein O-GlcNAc transferase
VSSSQTTLAESYFAHANSLIQQKQFNAAVESYRRAITINPDFVDAYINLGSALVELKQLEEAIKHYNCAIEIKPDCTLAYMNRGLVLKQLKQFEAAVSSYDRAIMINPQYAEAYFNRANAFQALGQLGAAIEDYERAIAIKPDYASAFDNRGLALNELNQLEAAVESHSGAIRVKPDFAEAYIHRGNALVDLNQLEAAVADYDHAYSMKPNYDYLLGILLQTKMRISDWTNLTENIDELVKSIERGDKASTSFPLNFLTNSPSIQRKATEIFAKHERPINDSLGNIAKRKASKKVRIAYFSADFRLHAVSILLAELIECHDKNRFEVIAFSFGPDVKDEMRERLEKAFDQFVDVRNLSDKETAILARQMSIDIAVDLGGDTANSRSGIFSYRVAPIQVNYLGYPGTMGVDYIDYLVADEIIIPKEYQCYYDEKIAYLPHCYQPGDTKREIAEKKFTRQELELPQEGFVFCCFSNNFKITPDIFTSWMQILKSVAGSVLYLSVDACSEKNLRHEAEVRGVDSNRLIFAKRLKNKNEYLARCKTMDLFLDTFPYTAHATANDVLWAGLPVLTLAGSTFASRVATSLLNTLKLPELITYTQEAYEELAIELAGNPDKFNAIKTKLAANRLTTPVFDTVLFARHIENAYAQMFQRYQSGLLPDHIYVESNCAPFQLTSTE